MEHAQLSAGTAKLHDSLQKLQAAWDEASRHWNDPNSRHLSRNHLDPLTPQVTKLLEAVHQMAEMLGAAHRDLDDAPRVD